MADAKSVERWFDGCPLPVWIVRDSEFAKEHPSFATHILKCKDGTIDLPLFTTEANAATYIANFPLHGHEAASIDTAADLRIYLELFRKRNGTHVRIDDPADGSGAEIFCPTIDGIISRLPADEPP